MVIVLTIRVFCSSIPERPFSVDALPVSSSTENDTYIYHGKLASPSIVVYRCMGACSECSECDNNAIRYYSNPPNPSNPLYIRDPHLKIQNHSRSLENLFAELAPHVGSGWFWEFLRRVQSTSPEICLGCTDE